MEITQHDAVDQSRQLDVVSITSAASNQSRIFKARHALADGEFTHGTSTCRIHSHWAGDREGNALIASTCFELFRHAWGEISKNPVTTGALECRQAFDHGALAVEPAVLRGCHDHRVLAGNLVCERRHPEDFLHALHDIEIGQARLDHYHVGAFLDVECDFA